MVFNGNNFILWTAAKDSDLANKMQGTSLAECFCQEGAKDWRGIYRDMLRTAAPSRSLVAISNNWKNNSVMCQLSYSTKKM